MKTKKKKCLVCDYDDCVVAFVRTVCRLHNIKYNTCLTDQDIVDWNFDSLNIKDARGNIVDGKKLRETFKYFEDNGLYAVLPPLDYAKYALDIAHDIGYTVIILTARPEKYRIQTELNLMIQEIYHDELYFDWDKAKVINKLMETYDVAFFADDKIETLRAIVKNCKLKNCFLINQPHNRNVVIEEGEGIERKNDLIDCIKELKKVNK